MLYFLFSSELGYSLNHMGVFGKYVLGENVFVFPILLSLMAISAFIAYLLGSFNTALTVSKRLYSEDIRVQGSGNPGFTNMMRIYGAKASAITFIGDFLKTVAADLIGWLLCGYMGALTAGLFAMLGHVFPIFYKFKGGKGIVCMTATIFMLDWRLFIILFAVFAVSVLVTKYISFGSVLCGMVLPIFVNKLYLISTPENARIRAYASILSFIITVIVLLKHRVNLKRIFNGTESKFEFRKSKKASPDAESDEKNG